MTSVDDDEFIATVLDKFIEAADWPVDRRVELCVRVSLLVRRLETGDIARDKRVGAIKARPARKPAPSSEPEKAAEK